MNRRLFVAKKTEFDLESQKLQDELQASIAFEKLQILQVYDLFDPPNDLDLTVLVDPVTDYLITDLEADKYFAVAYLPGQYDQRADAAEQCFRLLEVEGIRVLSGKCFLFWGISDTDLETAKKLLINPIESREKDLNKLELPQQPTAKEVPVHTGFIDYEKQELKRFHKNARFALALDDLELIQTYFREQKRNPTETELKVLDTYWSDHCRHTTFETEITEVDFQSEFNAVLQETYSYYLAIRTELGIQKPIRLMDLATIMAKYFRKTGKITNIDVSEEINACSIVVNVDEDGNEQPWLLQFKNETHNHPTEVEPYGGASTCIGGAIRDPLSGRAYVYQAMRVSGAGNPLERIEETLSGKLPQRKITQVAAKGYSGYGNQIGVATTNVQEFYHPGYTAKRMEVGFVMGAVPQKWVRRETPLPGDKVILLGGRTGRDGIGGATGSSKELQADEANDLSAEVQKGNAPVERKIQRLFRNKEALSYIKRCNDFGAGGVSVAIGEIARGVHIDLNQIPTKYSGLNGTELAISESQERMAVVVEAKDVERFGELAANENLEAKVVADITEEEVLRATWNGVDIVRLDRTFLDTNGVRKTVKVRVTDAQTSHPLQSKSWNVQAWMQGLSNLNNTSQMGLIDMFDCNVGRSTVLAPLGGTYQETPEQVSVHKLPTKGFTETVSMASFGFDPYLSEWNPYFGAYHAVYESVHKLLAAGGRLSEVHLSFQEYFERLRDQPERWGKPFAALLGALQAQRELGIAAIGGKDSMSGSYEDIDVPPTLISFAVCPSQVEKVRSSAFQRADSDIWIFTPHFASEYRFDPKTTQLFYTWLEDAKELYAARVLDASGIASGLVQMAWGNKIGFDIQTKLSLADYLPGAILLELPKGYDGIPRELVDLVQKIGSTSASQDFVFNGERIALEEARQSWLGGLEQVFPTQSSPAMVKSETERVPQKTNAKQGDGFHERIPHPSVLIPVFTGTNSEYDSAKAFEKEGATVQTLVIRNLNKNWLQASIEAFVHALQQSHILFIPGGFSMADEPDGSGKFIATFLRNPKVRDAVHNFLDRKCLILGVCNGFQALVKSGLLPYGRISDLHEDAPILFHNNLHRHVARMVRIRVLNEASPWLNEMLGEEYWIPISHGEGRWMANEQDLQRVSDAGCIATVYVDEGGNPDPNLPINPNGSRWNIEGITSPCGRIFGRMGHPERMEEGLFKNIPNASEMNIFANAVRYFSGQGG